MRVVDSHFVETAAQFLSTRALSACASRWRSLETRLGILTLCC